MAKSIPLQDALHKALLELGIQVWALEWCADWKNIRMFWDYTKGPGYLLGTAVHLHGNKLFLPVYNTVRNGHDVCYKSLASLNHLHHEDMAAIIQGMWLTDLPFKYPFTQETEVPADHIWLFYSDREILMNGWDKDEKLYQESHPHNDYRWTHTDIVCRSRKRALRIQNPYTCSANMLSFDGHINKWGAWSSSSGDEYTDSGESTFSGSPDPLTMDDIAEALGHGDCEGGWG